MSPCKRGFKVSSPLFTSFSLVCNRSYRSFVWLEDYPVNFELILASQEVFNLSLLFLFALRYLEAKKDRVTVVFSTVFKDDDDVIIGKVFMQVCETERNKVTMFSKVIVTRGRLIFFLSPLVHEQYRLLIFVGPLLLPRLNI